MIRLTTVLLNTHHHALCVFKRGFLKEKCCRRVADVAYDADRGCGGMVDAPDLGSGILMDVEVQVFSAVPFFKSFYIYLAYTFTIFLISLHAKVFGYGDIVFKKLEQYTHARLRMQYRCIPTSFRYQCLRT